MSPDRAAGVLLRKVNPQFSHVLHGDLVTCSIYLQLLLWWRQKPKASSQGKYVCTQVEIGSRVCTFELQLALAQLGNELHRRNGYILYNSERTRAEMVVQIGPTDPERGNTRSQSDQIPAYWRLPVRQRVHGRPKFSPVSTSRHKGSG